MSAARAYEGRKIFRDLIITPANTWKQPSSNEDSLQPFESEECALEELNDDCLLHLFDFCDLETLKNLCKMSDRFSKLIQCHVFQKHRKLKVMTDATFSLASFRETVRYIGSQLNDVKISSGTQYLDFDGNLHENRIIDIFTKYIGANIECLDIVHFRFTKRMQKQLRPIFSRLKQLKGEIYGKSATVHLSQLCPTLEKLDMNCEFFDIGTQSWPTLTAIHLQVRDINPESGLRSCRRFLERNPQLIELSIGAKFGYRLPDRFWESNGRALLSDINHFVHLEGLTINFYTSDADILPLRNLPKLRELSFTEWNSSGNLFASLEKFSHLPELMHLHLRFYDFWRDEKITQLDFEMEKLCQFTLRNCKLTEEIFIQIFEIAPALKKFNVNLIRSTMRLDESLLMRIVEIRKRQAERNLTPVIRLNLVLEQFIQCLDDSITNTVEKIRSRLAESKAKVILPDDHEDLPYCAEIAEVISIEFH